MRPRSDPLPLWQSLNDPVKKQGFEVELKNRFQALADSTEVAANLQSDYDSFIEVVIKAPTSQLCTAAKGKVLKQ
jgi:hypothetical protein